MLFLDEPTSGLDPVSRARMWEEVRRLNRELNMTIFLTTQYLEEADELADRVGIINDGRLVAEGTPEELKRSVGNDVIVARVDGHAQAARAAVRDGGGRAQRRGPRRRDGRHRGRRRGHDRAGGGRAQTAWRRCAT